MYSRPRRHYASWLRFRGESIILSLPPPCLSCAVFFRWGLFSQSQEVNPHLTNALESQEEPTRPLSIFLSFVQ